MGSNTRRPIPSIFLEFDYQQEQQIRVANTALITEYAKQIFLHLDVMNRIDAKLIELEQRTQAQAHPEAKSEGWWVRMKKRLR
jgi:hypothetical protein